MTRDIETWILAVSGGVDSMVMLDMLVREVASRGDVRVVVAHFDHGIRENSGEDADFVQKKTVEYVFNYGLGAVEIVEYPFNYPEQGGDGAAHEKMTAKFVLGRGALSEGASEAAARKARYEFLEAVARRYQGRIFTAHHVDDLVESVAINLLRGTGWRGLAAMDRADVVRPFLIEPRTKREIWRYAGEHGIEFREDATNNSERYLRNRVRERLLGMPEEDKMVIYKLWRGQVERRTEIDATVRGIIPRERVFKREWFRGMDDKVAMELLRQATLEAGVAATRPELRRFLDAIRNYEPGKSFNLPQDKLVRLTKTNFAL